MNLRYTKDNILAKAINEIEFIYPSAKAGGNSKAGHSNANDNSKAGGNSILEGNTMNRNEALAHSHKYNITKLALAKQLIII